MRKKLLDIFELLLKTHGKRHWWPAKSSFEMVVGAFLTQNTAWSNVEKAIRNLQEAQVLSPALISDLPLDELEKLIQPSGYFRQKAQRLQFFSRYLMERYGGVLSRLFEGSLEDVRKELLSQKGIGPETADSILLYAGNRATFVVDAYTVRIFSRLGILGGEEKYDAIRSLFMSHLPRDPYLFNEYHALIVEHGKICCRKRNPFCGHCCLRQICHHREVR